MYNQITLVGRWTRDTEITMSKKGTEILRGSLAVNDSYNKEHTDFVDITAFGKLAVNANQFTGKGSKVLVSGKLRHERWEKDGQKRSKHVVIANQILFLDDKGQSNHSVNSNSSNSNQQKQPSKPEQPQSFEQAGEQINIGNDELPF